MAHLTPEQMLDIAEGTRPSAEFPHVSTCAACAAHVETISRTIALAAEVDVPEPSPLFWDHLSERIRDRVAQEATPGAFRWRTFASLWRVALTAAAAALLVLAGGLVLQRGGAPAPETPTALAVHEPGIVESLVTIDDDPALALLADLSAELDWDAASEAGLVPAHGAVDNVLVALTAEERNELQRILEEALSAAGV